MPIKSNPSPTAAIPVVPDPINGSRMTPPGGVTNLQRYFMRAIGFTVG